MPPEPPPSNALWLTFIAAWRDHAQAKGSKAAQTYQKAYRSLSACPIPFQHPCQTTQLVGIGPMIAKRLEQDLQKWCQENGETMPERPEAPQPASKSRASKSSSTAEASGQIGEPSELTSVQDATRKKPRATKKKAYVPQPRSGAYGLLLGLYLQTRPGPGGEEVYLSKADLIDSAQPHCDSDYLNGGARTAVTASLVTTGAGDPTASTSSRGKSTYSAWSSMKTLISKDLVYQTGNPPKFCLSEEGFELARTMAEAEGIRPKGSGLASGSTSSREEPHEEVGVKRPSKRLRLPGSTEGPEGASAPKRTSRSGPREADSVVPLQTGVGSTRSLFRYAYLTDGVDIDAVLSRSDAASRPSRRGSGLCYHIRFPRELCSHSLVVKHVEMVQEDATSSDMLTGFLHELKADLIAPGLRGSGPDVTAVATSSTAVVASETASINFEEWDQATVVQHSLLNTTTNPPRRRAPRLSQVVPPPAAGESWHSRLAPSPRSHQTASRPLDSPNRHRRVASGSSVVLADDGPMPLSSPLRRTPSETHHELGTSVNEDMDGDVGASRETRWTDTEGRPKFRPIHLPAGSYTIHLILDNRERHHAGFANQRVSLASALESKGVEVEVRPLELGDAIWIARRKDGGGAEGDEAVLDFIVERKRLDDLTSSILDGRWRDQKFRLSSSGLSQVLYLIEDHDVDNQMRRFGGQIQTALSSTQVVDGFFVERTACLDASIKYLTRMDRVVRETYENTSLSVIPDASISRASYLQMQAELRRSGTYLTTFAAFQALNSKSASLTLRDICGKMLLCIRGMSAEKVSEVLDVWQTPHDLWYAYNQPGITADALLSSTINPPEQRKRVGPALSAKVASLFRQPSYTS